MIIDTHCHIDMYPNPIEILQENERLGIKTIAVTHLPSHFEMGYSHLLNVKKIRLALGLHPLLANDFDNEFPIFLKNVDRTSYIGEVGLDFSSEGIKTKEKQIFYLKKILSINSLQNKLISLHSRKAEHEVLDILIENKIPNAIFHWYSGSLATIDKIIQAGYFFSINTAMIKSKSGNLIIKRIPKTRLLTESDGPYIEVNNKNVRSIDVKLIISYLTEFWNESTESVELQINNNFNKLLQRVKNK